MAKDSNNPQLSNNSGMTFKKLYIRIMQLFSVVIMIAGVLLLLDVWIDTGILDVLLEGGGRSRLGVGFQLTLGGLFLGGYFLLMSNSIKESGGAAWCIVFTLFAAPVSLPALFLSVLTWPIVSWIMEKKHLKDTIEYEKNEIIAMIDKASDEKTVE